MQTRSASNRVRWAVALVAVPCAVVALAQPAPPPPPAGTRASQPRPPMPPGAAASRPSLPPPAASGTPMLPPPPPRAGLDRPSTRGASPIDDPARAATNAAPIDGRVAA